MARSKKDQALMDEMSIVDIFTKLIFDAQSALDDSEVQVLELLTHYDETLLKASRRDLSEYLRAMGVDEMIKVVSVLKSEYEKQGGLLASVISSHEHPAHY
jgi:hypothetical protein